MIDEPSVRGGIPVGLIHRDAFQDAVRYSLRRDSPALARFQFYLLTTRNLILNSNRFIMILFLKRLCKIRKIEQFHKSSEQNDLFNKSLLTDDVLRRQPSECASLKSQ